MKKLLLYLLGLALVICANPTTAAPFQETATQASQGKKLNFQGTLYENGAPVSGERNFTFSIDLGEGNSWTETQSNVQVIEGLYAVVLGSVTPMPENLFYDTNERLLTVSIGNTVLGTTPLYAPFALDDSENLGTAIFQLEAKGKTDTVALTGEIYGVGNNSEYAAGLRGFAHTDTTANTGVSGIAFGGPDNKRFNTAVRGDSYTNTPEAWSTGTWGIGNSQNGGTAYGMRGEVFGQGSSFTAAARGLNFMIPSENGTRYGGYFTTHPAAEVHSGTSIGVSGFARGSQENIGLYGRAFGPEGTDNWAGRFDGNVAIRDGALELSQEGQLFASISRNEQNSGSIALKSSVDSVNVLIDSNGEKAGLIHLNDSLGRANLRMLTYAGGGSYLEQHAGLPDIGETRVTYQLVGNANPWTNMIARNADGTAKGRVQSGWLPGAGELGQFRISAGDNRTLAQLMGNVQDGGSILLEGPSSSNFWIGQKNWEDSNLPFMGMRGAFALDNGNGGTYNPDLLQLEVNRYEDGTELGQINFSKSTGDGTQTVSLNYDNVRNLVSTGYFNNENGLLFRLDSDGITNDRGIFELFGSELLTNENGDTYLPPLVQLAAESKDVFNDGFEYGLIRLLNQNGNNTIEMAGDASGRIELWGENGNTNASISSRGNGNFGHAQFYNDNGELRSEIGSFGDNSGFMQLYGPNGSKNIQMGGSDGNRDLGMLRLSGTTENSLVSMEVTQDGANTEYGILNLSNAAGGGFEIGSRSWENNNQGGNNTYTAIRSTVDVADGNGGTYRPWLVSQEFHQDENGNQYGSIGINSTNNTGFVSLNPGNSGNIDISGSLNQSSDARLKKNITNLTSGLAIVNKLRGVRYNWKDENRTENKIGFIAQEVEEVLPELVKTRENGFKGVNYAEMTAVLVEAVKELSAQVNALKAENSTLKAEASKVEAMEERLAKIESLLLNNVKTVNANQK